METKTKIQEKINTRKKKIQEKSISQGSAISIGPTATTEKKQKKKLYHNYSKVLTLF